MPDALIGHGVGEYVAACLAGVFILRDALRVIAVRGRMIEEMPAGAIAEVALAPERLLGLLGDGVALAAVNEPAVCTVAGTSVAVAQLIARLAGDGIACWPAPTPRPSIRP